MSDNTKYIDKAKAEAQGFVRTSAGVVRLTTITGRGGFMTDQPLFC